MKKSKESLDTNKYAKKLNNLLSNQPDTETTIEVLRKNLKDFDHKLSKQILKKIIHRHQEILKNLATKAEYYKDTNNILSYRSNQITFQKENDLLVRLNTEFEYLTLASQDDFSKGWTRYPKPILALSKEEMNYLKELTGDDNLFSFEISPVLNRLARLDEIKMEIMIPLKKARRILKQVKIKESKKEEIDEDLKDEQEQIKKLCNCYLEYLDKRLVYEHHQQKKEQKQQQEIIDEYILTKQNKEKVKSFLNPDIYLMTKEDFIFCIKYILYKGDILDLIPVFDKRMRYLTEIITGAEQKQILKSIQDIIKYRKSKLEKNSIERNFLKNIESLLRKKERQEKQAVENSEEEWARLFNLIQDNNQKISLLCKKIKENPNCIFYKYYGTSYLEYMLERYFNFILNKKQGLTTEDVIAYQNEKNFYEQFLYTSFQEFSNTPQADKLKHLLEYYYYHFLEISDKNKMPVEQKKYILASFKNLMSVFIKQPKLGNNNQNKKDLSGRYIMTIDDDKAKVLEDAFSITDNGDTTEFVVYVMDVVHEQPLNDEIFDMFAVGSLFTKGKRQSMSLKQNRVKDVIAYIFELDKKTLKPISFQVQKDKITVKKNYTFSEVDNLLTCADETKNKIHIENVRQFVTKINQLGLIHTTDIDDFSYLSEAIISFFKKLYINECQQLAYPLLYRQDGYVDDDKKTNRYNSYPLNDSQVSLTSPVRKLESYINQLLSVWYFVQNRVNSPKDIEKITSLIEHYAYQLNQEEKKLMLTK